MKPALDSIIARYGRVGIVVDSNLLLLYFVGRLDPDQIARFKRTKQFTANDFALLLAVVNRFPRIIVTPNILTEVSNLSGAFAEAVQAAFFLAFTQELSQIEERYVPSAEAAQQEGFTSMGLTDAGICRLVQNRFPVLTDDFALSGRLRSLGVEALNFRDLQLQIQAELS